MSAADPGDVRGRQEVAEPEDARLLELFVGQNDQSAFTALVRRHRPAVAAVCRRVLREYPDLVDDAEQDTFMVLWRNALSGRLKPGPLGPWLRETAKRQAMHLR